MAKSSVNVLILSGAASAINYINSLSCEPDVCLHVADTDPYCPGLYATNVIPHWLPRARDTGPYRLALDRMISDNEIDVLIPTSDYDAAGVISYLNDGWAPPVVLFRPPWAAHQRMSDKRRLMETLQELLPEVVPRTWVSGDADNAIEYPVVVKPLAESGGKGVAIARGPTDLTAALARAGSLYGQDVLIQQFIPGRTYIVSMVYDRDGRCIVTIPMRSHLTFFTWGGGGCAGEVVDDPELCDLCASVVEACGGWRGPINLEWRRHAGTARYYLMEANCRLNGYSYLTTMNGVCLPRVVLSLLTGRALPPLALPPPGDRHNFVLGFRETPIGRDWIMMDQPRQNLE